jgi:hypothetical protein
VFSFLAFIWNSEGSKLFDVNVRYFTVVFWALVIVAIVRRVLVGERIRNEDKDSYSVQNEASAPAKESSQEAQLRLTAEMQAVTNWIGFIRFMWMALKLFCALYLLYEIPEIFAALVGFYLAWKGWVKLFGWHRNKVWALAAKRPFEVISTQPQPVAKNQSRSLFEHFERTILWVAILPIRLAVHLSVLAINSLTGFVIKVFTNLKFIEPFLLYALILPLRWIALGLQHLDFVKQVSYDLVVVISLWCISLLLVLSMGHFL